MIEFIVLVGFGMMVGWFVIPPPDFIVSAKNSLVKEWPWLGPFLRKDVD